MHPVTLQALFNGIQQKSIVHNCYPDDKIRASEPRATSEGQLLSLNEMR